MAIRSALAVSVCLCGPALANAQMSDIRCDDSTRINRMLTTVLGAERLGMGLRDPETLLEVWVTQTSGDWLIVQNYTNGTSCIVAMGDHWEDMVPGPT